MLFLCLPHFLFSLSPSPCLYTARNICTCFFPPRSRSSLSSCPSCHVFIIPLQYIPSNKQLPALTLARELDRPPQAPAILASALMAGTVHARTIMWFIRTTIGRHASRTGEMLQMMGGCFEGRALATVATAGVKVLARIEKWRVRC